MAQQTPAGLVPGITATLEVAVTPELTADRYGNQGVRVLATPALAGLMEAAAIRCIAPFLGPGQGSVGTRIDLQHLAPTPVGLTVQITARLVEIDRRRLVFEIEAQDGFERIATCRHERFLVDMQRFLERAQAKATASTDSKT